MSIWQSLFLGLIQGLTEFLPVSSSGHLVIMQKLLGVQKPGITLEVMLHFGTLIAVLIFFSSDLYRIYNSLKIGLVKLLKREDISEIGRADPMIRIAFFIILASIPTAIIGLIIERFFSELFEATLPVGISLIITGAILWLSSKKTAQARIFAEMKTDDALLIGIAQGLAVIPGISRSGATISTGLLRGLDRKDAARFSFLLSIPALLGVSLKEIPELTLNPSNSLALLGGVVIAVISGYIALRILINLLEQGKFYFFAYYCWAVGIIGVVGSLW